MWEILLADGSRIVEDDCLWPNVPVDVVVSELSYTDHSGVNGSLNGFERYGFQRFVISMPGGKRCGFGTQLIGIHANIATIIEIDETTGIRTKNEIQYDNLTYSENLLRNGS